MCRSIPITGSRASPGGTCQCRPPQIFQPSKSRVDAMTARSNASVFIIEIMGGMGVPPMMITGDTPVPLSKNRIRNLRQTPLRIILMSLHDLFLALQNPIGTQPIAWSNDDFHELGGNTPLDQCLSEMRLAGYEGTEFGHKFPRTALELSAKLAAHGLRLISVWHSSYLATRDY